MSTCLSLRDSTRARQEPPCQLQIFASCCYGVKHTHIQLACCQGNDGLDAIDVWNTTSKTWSHAKMSAARTLFDGAAIGFVRPLPHLLPNQVATWQRFSSRRCKTSITHTLHAFMHKCMLTLARLPGTLRFSVVVKEMVETRPTSSMLSR